MKKIVNLYGLPSEIFNELNERAKEYAASKGLEYVWIPMDPFTKESAIAALKGADAGIIDVETYDKEIFEQIKDSVKILVRYGVGFDAVNLQDATKAGIAISRTTAANSEAVAEMAFTMIMAAKRLMMKNRACVNTGNWDRFVGSEMLGKKLGILGFGAIGRKLAKLFSGFDCEVLVYDPYLPDEAATAAGAKKVELDDIFKECDAISIHVPYTKENHHIVNAERLAMMKETSVIVCTARGNLVDEDALYDALKNHRILGAGLDVFATEPLPVDSPLIGLDNIILTPHVSAQTREALWNMYEKAIDVAASYLNGEDLGRDLLNADLRDA
ncbi:MAG: phosphoglycerate dehydrogenase [Lachnospiraceae bacterium]|nr:phosphoglycerate dehydrogenase [Lachnospiraceae bacterium]